MNNNLPAAAGAPEPRGGLPATSLVIGSRNRPVLLAETVESVLQGDEVPSEIVIIDQSTSPQPALADLKTKRACAVRYLWTQSVGLSRARNAGIRAAQHDLLIIIDDDMWVTSNWFGCLVRALIEAGPRSVVCGQVRPSSAPAGGGMVPAIKTDAEPAVYTAPGEADVLYGNLAIFRSALEAVGVFDERLGPGTVFPAAEDSDLGYRLLRSGYRIIYAPQAVLYHRGWRSSGDYLRLRWNYGLGRGGFYAKYLSWHDPYMRRRLLADLRNHLGPLPRRIWHERPRAYSDVCLAAGVLWGAMRWTLTNRKSRLEPGTRATRL